MMIAFLLRGIILGFSIAAPVGAIGILCIRRTLTQGRAVGLASGLGAATADAVYGSIAGFGLTAISGLLMAQQVWLRVIGGLFLCYLGVTTFIARPIDPLAATSARTQGLLGSYLSTFALTLTNPMTILSYAAIFAGLGLASTPGGYLSATLLVVGVFTGSALWWLLLTGGISLLRGRLTPGWLCWINRLSGVILVAFGLVVLSGLL